MSKEFHVIVYVPTTVTVNAETADDALLIVKSKMSIRDAAAATFVVAEELWYNEENKCYHTVEHTTEKEEGGEKNEHQENIEA